MKQTVLNTCLAALLAGALHGMAQDSRPAAPTPGQDRNRTDRTDRTDRGGWTRGGMGIPGMDDKQRELYREASEKNRETLTQLDEKLRAAQQALMKAVLAENYDEKAVREKAEAVAKIQTDITMLRAKALSTVSPTLKPEQREQLETSRFGAAMLTGGGFGGFGGPGTPGGFGGPGTPGAPGGDTGRGGFRGRDSQGGPGAPGGTQQGPGDRGDRGGRRGPPSPQ